MPQAGTGVDAVTEKIYLQLETRRDPTTGVFNVVAVVYVEEHEEPAPEQSTSPGFNSLLHAALKDSEAKIHAAMQRNVRQAMADIARKRKPRPWL